MAPSPPSGTLNPRKVVCAECDHCAVSCFGPTYGQKSCARRSYESHIHGTVSIIRTAEYERAWLWRFIGLDTCGPEGRYWVKRRPCPSPPPHPTR